MLPRKGWRTITVKDDVFDKFDDWYQDIKKKGKLPNGVTTFAGFFNYQLTQKIQNEEKLLKIALQIKNIPPEFREDMFKLKSSKDIMRITS